MPILTMSTITPLNRYWTHEAVASQAMVLTGTIDNEVIQLDNVRNHINSCISHLAALLNIATIPHYGIWLRGTLETALHPTGLEWINLATAAGGVVPSQMITSIKNVSAPRLAINTTTNFIGNCRKYSLPEITQLDNNQNLQYRFTIGWCHHGSDLLVFTGSDIATTNKVNATAPYVLSGNALLLSAFRKPLLDNLRAPSNAAQAAGGNYRANVDLPDEYIDLLVKMVQKKILEQRREAVPANLEQEVNLGLQAIGAGVNKEIQFEKAEREKARYGSPQSGGYYQNNQE